MTRQAVPPWRQVAASLRQRIEAGEWPPGGPMPTLETLASEYGVGQTTVRKAMAELREAGLVESVRGWGTFVSEP
jgi:DNA-binding GntR family transcriptional regulator